MNTRTSKSSPSSLGDTAQELKAIHDQWVDRFEQPICQIPSRADLAQLVEVFRLLTFPMYALEASPPVPGDNPLLDAVEVFFARLRRLICWGLEHSPEPMSAEERKDAADRIAGEMVLELPRLNRLLLTDVQAAVDGDPACTGRGEVVICYPGFLATMVHRLSHELYLRQVSLLPRMLSEWVHSETGIDIHPGARIGSSFFIDHGTGVVIGETCVVGDRVRVYQSVTLGALSFAKDNQGNLVRNTKRHPTIENDVVIYANATILGGNTVVGHHSVIGSNVWLTTSVDPLTTVVMEKPRLRFRNQSPTAFDSVSDYQI